MNFVNILIYFIEAFTSLMIIDIIYSKKNHSQLLIFSFFLFIILVCLKEYSIYTNIIRFLFIFIYMLIVCNDFEINYIFISLLSTLALDISYSIATVIYYMIFFKDNVDYFIIKIIAHFLYAIVIYILALFIKNSHYFNKRLLVLMNVSILIVSYLYASLLDGIFINEYSGAILIISTVLLIIMIMIFYEVKNDAKKLYEKQLQLEILKLKRDHYLLSKESIEQTKRLKHDLSHIYNSIIYELDHHEIQKAKDILTRQIIELKNLNKVIVSGNDVIDYCIALQREKINKKKVEIYTDRLSEIPMEDEDLFILFGNLIANAVEYCEPYPYCQIIISAGKMNNYFYLKLKNTISLSVFIDNPKLMTNKDNKEDHGKGIKICKNIVSKYNGQLSFNEDEQFFCVNVIIPLESLSLD